MLELWHQDYISLFHNFFKTPVSTTDGGSVGKLAESKKKKKNEAATYINRKKNTLNFVAWVVFIFVVIIL